MKDKNRKEMIREYKEMQHPVGVYQIKNNITGKVIIASSLNLTAMLNRETFALKSGGHPNKALQKDWNEYGESAFTFQILEQIEPKEGEVLNQSELKDEVKLLEEIWLEKLQASCRL
jgi:hypothetical protein